jgi:uncharacterized membrane protein YgcG
LKTKVIIVVAALVVALLGFGAWSMFRSGQQAPSPSPTQQSAAVPSIQLNIPEESLTSAQESKRLQVAVRTEDYRGIARVEYLVDGQLVTYSTQAPFDVEIDISGLAPGEHTLQAIAYGVKGGVGKSKIFTFTLSDKKVEPANDDSQTIVEQSVAGSALGRSVSRGVTASTSTGGSQNSGGGNSGGGGDNGGGGDTTPWPDTPTVSICGNTSLLSGPSSAPAGAVVVPAGDNSGVSFGSPSTTYWFATGTHSIGTNEFSQIAPGNNSTFVGAPGAILTGQNLNRYAFTGGATNVKIQYLTIKDFVAPRDEGVINHNSGVGWTMEYITAQNNKGGAVFVATNGMLRYSCLKDNGQYGFQVYSGDVGGPQNATLDHNEIVGNNTDDWDTQIPGCGCTGGGKFWDAHTVNVTNNYVHNNLSVGLWADTNDSDFLVENNYIADNQGQGLFYEISYNMIVRNNNFLRNGWVGGAGNSSFPTGAIYLSESGGDSRVAGRTDKIDIHDNQFADNWGGVILWENADRFCSSPANTSSGYCTIVSPSATLANCTDPANGGHVNVEPYKSDCRWKTKNVSIHNNVFSMNRSAITGCTTTASCGFQGIFANNGSFPSWSPYMGSGIQDAITFNQNNHFTSNTYVGDWKYRAKTENLTTIFAIWQGTPYSQDVGSTYNGADHQQVTNYLDDNTATLEGGIGQWVSWFSTTVAQSTAEAHTGTHSLKINITAPFGWGVELSNSAGEQVTTRDKHISFWAKLGAGTNIKAKMEVRWLDASQSLLRTDVLTSPILTSTWQETSQTITPPVGATNVSTAVDDSSGTTGNSLYLDDIVIGDSN